MELDEKARVAVAKAICSAMGDDWEREGPGDVLLEAYGPLADAALSALRPGSETDGFVLMPREPTEAMIDAYTAAADDNDGPAAMYLDIKGYRAMLAAAGGENG